MLGEREGLLVLGPDDEAPVELLTPAESSVASKRA